MVCGLWSTGVLWFVVCGLWSTGVTNLVNLGVRVGVRVGDGFWTEGEASDSESASVRWHLQLLRATIFDLVCVLCLSNKVTKSV